MPTIIHPYLRNHRQLSTVRSFLPRPSVVSLRHRVRREGHLSPPQLPLRTHSRRCTRRFETRLRGRQSVTGSPRQGAIIVTDPAEFEIAVLGNGKCLAEKSIPRLVRGGRTKAARASRIRKGTACGGANSWHIWTGHGEELRRRRPQCGGAPGVRSGACIVANAYGGAVGAAIGRIGKPQCGLTREKSRGGSPDFASCSGKMQSRRPETRGPRPPEIRGPRNG